MTNSVEIKAQDAAASVETSYTISVNSGFEGVLAGRSDEDWIRVELVAGKNYDIRLSGIGPEAVPDTVLTIYDSDGEEIASNDDIEVEALNLFSMLEFTPESSGVYYIGAAGYQSRHRDNSGTYEVTVFDDEDDNPDTPLAVSAGERFQGTLDDKFDEDWIRVDLVEGTTYNITLDGIGPDADTDTVLSIYNQEGEQVGFHDDVDYGAGMVNSRLAFTPDTTAAYYISAGAYRGNPTQDNAGRYQVAVYEADASLVLTGTRRSDYYFHNRLKGSPGDDELDGKGGWDWLEGGAGADILIGGAGEDTASYQYSDAGVEVRLDDGTARGGHAQGDVFAGRKTVGIVAGDEKPLNSEVPDFEEFIISIVFTGEEEQAEAVEIEILDIEDLFGSAHDDILVGTYGANYLQGYYGDDVLDGREGNDRLYGGGGADMLIGGAGIDTASYVYSDEGVEVDLHNGIGRGGYAEGDTFPGKQVIEYTDPAGETREMEVPDIENLYGSLHDDILVGANGSNRLIGYKGDDELDGRGGHDLLEGRAGADVLRGGEGNDLSSYAFSDEAVEVRLHNGIARGGEAEGDTYPGRKTVEYVNAAGEPREIEVPDVEDLIGSAHDDILVGAHGPNRLGGYKGDDELDGREGDDWLDGGPGADMLRGGEGNDTASWFFSREGVEVRLHNGTARGGEAEGDSFAITVKFGDAEDMVQLLFIPDIENLHGSTQADILAGDLRDNRINGDAGDDVLYGGPGGGDDLLLGGPGDDRLYGGIGNDTLEGGPGDDRLRGGPDDDMLDGGEGDDAFIIATGGGNDTILDFGNGADIVDLAAFADIRSTADLTLLQQDSHLVIDLSAQGGGTLTLQDFNESDITDAHFVFFTDDGPAMA
ncbi:MAG: pre-peptidase C-terminal domain-containing protein [Gammaproteobacteria bacterium]|nr:pre-peptidase C-terminal domain-containing protein [Gammaproteobacteria bacterium]